MRSLLFGLIGLVVVGVAPAFGQTPPPATYGPGENPAAGNPYDGRGFGYDQLNIGRPAAPSLGVTGSANCCKRSDYVCVPEEYKKKTPKTSYTCGCEPFCVDFPFGFARKHCCDCDQPPARIRKFLIKKVKVCETVETRCAPAPAPCCESCPSGGCATGSCPSCKGH